jgi:subtilase family serine protease
MSNAHTNGGGTRGRVHQATKTFAALALLAGLALGGNSLAHASVPEGFGAATPAGNGKPIVHVTNLNDSGAGSLREALSAGNRTIVFDVAGTIRLTSQIYVRGSYITIDGTTAPSPGITLAGEGLAIHGSGGSYYDCGSRCYGVHDVIVRGLRIRDSVGDGLRIAHGAYNIVVDHVSIQGSFDGNLDITESHDVTVQWSVLAEGGDVQKNMLIKYSPSRVTLHHNIFVAAQQRNPQVKINDEGDAATDTTLDMRNNVVWDWLNGYGTYVWMGPRANVVGNYYSSPNSDASEQADAIRVESARAYVAGNVSGDNLSRDVNSSGTETSPFPAPPVAMQGACDAAWSVLAGAGVRPLDSVDQTYVGRITLRGCGSAPSTPAPLADLAMASLTAPGSTTAGARVTLGGTTRNGGNAAAPASTTRFYLSTDATVGSGDVALGVLSVPPLAAGASSSGSVAVTIPATTAARSYYVIARADDGSTVSEALETNNATAMPITVSSTSAPASSALADLTVTAATYPSTGTAGTSITVGATTRNAGTASAGASTTRIYLSADAVVGSGDTALGAVNVPSLAAGASSTATTTVQVPAGLPAGTFYVIARADDAGAVAESNEGNNARAAGTITIAAAPRTSTGPDLVISAVSAPTSARPGASITVSAITRNQGTVSAGSTRTRFFLSADTNLGASDLSLGSKVLSSLAAGASASGSATSTIPGGTAPGTWYIIAMADVEQRLGESNERNNTAFVPITIGTTSVGISGGSTSGSTGGTAGIDLLFTAASAPTRARAGSGVSMGYTLKNAGTLTAAASRLKFLLSRDAADGSDVSLGAREIGSLASGATTSGEKSLTIPSGTAAGAYYLLIVTDRDGIVGEINEGNNVVARRIVVE